VRPPVARRGAPERSDLVGVDAGRVAAGSSPGHATRLHEAIFFSATN
jgi:hypothetical protein